jgi:hypothetical protein
VLLANTAATHADADADADADAEAEAEADPDPEAVHKAPRLEMAFPVGLPKAPDNAAQEE